MRYLTIIRHAQAENDSTSGADMDRVLTKKGTKDSVRLGSLLKERDIRPDLILTSGAKRAIETAEGIRTGLGCDPKVIRVEERLYHANAAGIIGIVRNIPMGAARVFLVGHNPTVTEALNGFSPGASDGMHAGTGAGLEFDDDTWMTVTFGGTFGSAKLLFYLEPEA